MLENNQDIIIKNDFRIGTNTTIFKGVRIGEGSIAAAAGSIATNDVEDYSISGGVPSEKIKKISRRRIKMA